MSDIRNIVKKFNQEGSTNLLNNMLTSLEAEGLKVEFGRLGLRTTYALIHNEDHSVEILGYTYLQNMKYYNDTTGKIKALQQAIARKKVADEIPDN